MKFKFTDYIKDRLLGGVAPVSEQIDGQTYLRYDTMTLKFLPSGKAVVSVVYEGRVVATMKTDIPIEPGMELAINGMKGLVLLSLNMS